MKRKKQSRWLSFFIAFAITVTTLVGGVPVMAADTGYFPKTDASISEMIQNTEEVQRLRNKIDALTSDSSSTRETYKTDYWGQVTFTNSNIGAWHTIYGHQARVAIAYKPVDGNTALTASLSTGFWGWTLYYNPNNVDSDGYCMYVGPWEDITYQGAYRMIYDIWTTGNGGVHDGRRASFHVWIDYK